MSIVGGTATRLRAVRANHTFDFLWGGWGYQITRWTLEEFLGNNL